MTLDVVGGADRVGHVRLAGERWLAVSGADVPICRRHQGARHGRAKERRSIVWPADGQLPVVPRGDEGDAPLPSTENRNRRDVAVVSIVNFIGLVVAVLVVW